jgi:hypothetical protein
VGWQVTCYFVVTIFRVLTSFLWCVGDLGGQSTPSTGQYGEYGEYGQYVPSIGSTCTGTHGGTMLSGQVSFMLDK